MSATEDDTELRDLLIQNLENNGVLNKLKAEMRAAVFLAMEEQDKLENKSPLVNENLKKCLNTKDGRLVASLIMDFLQVFHLDFSLAVFQPEINALNGLDGRDAVCRDLGLSEVNRNCPLLLELVRRGRHRPAEGDRNVPKEPSQKQISFAQKKFDFYDKDGSGAVAKEDLRNVFTDLFPGVHRNLLEKFISDELRAADRSSINFQVFLGIYKRLYSQCRTVVLQDTGEEKVSPPTGSTDSEGKGDVQLGSRTAPPSSGLQKEHPDLDLEEDDDPDDGDSFFDDPLPKPQKTYGCVPLREECLSGPGVSPMRRGRSLSDLSVLAADDRPSEHSQTSELRKVEASGSRGSPAGSLSEAPRPGAGSSASEQSHGRNGASSSKERGFRDSKAPNDRTGSLHLDDDVEYDDDFNSHRSDLSKSELSIGEEIEEVSIEGPDISDKLDETTQDVSVSQLSQSHGADYMEAVN